MGGWGCSGPPKEGKGGGASGKGAWVAGLLQLIENLGAGRTCLFKIFPQHMYVKVIGATRGIVLSHLWGRPVRCARAVRKVGSFGPVSPDGQDDRSHYRVPIRSTAHIPTQSKQLRQ